MVTFQVQDSSGQIKTIEAPVDMNLTLMEILRASEYDIAAVCGGMALCATCHVEVTNGPSLLNDKNDQELDTLDTIPDATSKSRLACQIRISEKLENIIFTLKCS
jgi:2Fe-2S ferredoxin